MSAALLKHTPNWRRNLSKPCLAEPAERRCLLGENGTDATGGATTGVANVQARATRLPTLTRSGTILLARRQRHGREWLLDCAVPVEVVGSSERYSWQFHRLEGQQNNVVPVVRIGQDHHEPPFHGLDARKPEE